VAKTSKVTNQSIRARQPEIDNLNLRKRGAMRPPTGDVAAVSGFRAAHERAHAGLELTNDVPALHTPSMSRRPSIGGVDSSPHLSPDHAPGRPPMD
jgi:hypothetical protein